MNATRLLDYYERIVDAPDAIQRMRRLILDLAVCGKLVAQVKTEPTSISTYFADVTVCAAQQNVASLWSLPPNWVFVPLIALAGNSGLLTDGDWVESKDQDTRGDVRLIQLADVGARVYRNRSARFMTRATAERLNCTFLSSGDVLIARMPDPIGRACIFPGDQKHSVTVVDVAVLRVDRTFCNERFVMLAINADLFAKNIHQHVVGTTRARISGGNLKQLPIPLPPLSEQHRIVAKVDELMAICDDIEVKRTQCETTRDRFTSATLARLNTPDSKLGTFIDHARFAIQSLDVLTVRTNQIKRLRETILNLAVCGKLVPQDPVEIPCIPLGSAQAQMSSRGEDTASVWEIPANWQFVPLMALAGQLGLFTDGDWVESKDQDLRGDVRLIQLADVGAGAYRNRSARFMTRTTAERLGCTFLSEGDVLIARMPDPIGRACVFPGDSKPSVTVVDVAVLRVERECCSEAFVTLAINSRLFASNIGRYVVGTTRARISRGNLKGLPFPLPPRAEQIRILKKVDELNTLCDQLENALISRDEQEGRLLNALIAEALNPAPSNSS